MSREEILCNECEAHCGWAYPDTWSEPGWSEGKGEDFTDDQGEWYCCQKCLDAHNERVALCSICGDRPDDEPLKNNVCRFCIEAEAQEVLKYSILGGAA
jgi:peptide methionine sulfoxide reductase MsrB